jgi:hypothetical protein
MTGRGFVSPDLPGIRLAIAIAIFMFLGACVSVDCSYDVAHRPDPIFLHVEDGAIYGQNYVACFVIDGVVHKEYIPECAYRYYYDRQARRASAGMWP